MPNANEKGDIIDSKFDLMPENVKGHVTQTVNKVILSPDEPLWQKVTDSTADNIAVLAPIRTGKTYALCSKAVQWVEQGHKVIIVVRAHELAKHIVKTLDSMDAAVLHLAGHNHRELNYNVKHSITPFNFYNDPHFKALKKITPTKAIDYAKVLLEGGDVDIIVTVPELAVKLKGVADCLMLDEITAVRWFKPTSLLIYEWYRTRDLSNQHITDLIAKVKAVIKDYKKLQQFYDGYLDQIEELITNMPKAIKEERARGTEHPEKVVVNRVNVKLNVLSLQLNNKLFEQRYGIKYDIKRYIEDDAYRAFIDTKRKEFYGWLSRKLTELLEKTKLLHNDDEREVKDFILASLNGTYEAVTTPEGVKVYLRVRDPEILIFKDWLNSFDHIVVSSNLEHEEEVDWFFAKLNRDYDKIIEPNYPYKANFNIILTENLYRAAKDYYDRGVAVLHITGRKRDAEKVRQELDRHGVYSVIADSRDTCTRERIVEYARQGVHVIIYANSRVSKGIDLPCFSVAMVHSYHFATPDYDRDTEIMSELWQMVMRISPTPKYGDAMPKFVIFKKTRKTNNFIPCPYMTQEPIFVRAKDLAKLNGLFCGLAEHNEKNGVNPNKTNLSNDQYNGKVLLYKSGYSGSVNFGALRKYWLVVSLFGEKLKKPVLKQKNFDVTRFVKSVSGKQLTRDQVFEVFRQCGITTQKLIKDMLRAMTERGYLTKKRQGRRVIYCFASLIIDKGYEVKIDDSTMTPALTSGSVGLSNKVKVKAGGGG